MTHASGDQVRASAFGIPHHNSRGGRAHVLLLWLVAGGCRFEPGHLASVDAAPEPSVDAAQVIAPDASVPPDAAPDAFAGATVRVNIAGVAHTGVDYPGAWAADLGVCPGATTLAVTATINQTNDGELFQAAAVADSLRCTIGGLPRGTYYVTLLFAEIGQPACGATPDTRSFSIALENTIAIPAFDLMTEGNGCALAGKPGHPVSRLFSVAVTDGALSLELTKVGVGQPALLSAVQAIQMTAL